MKPCAQARRLFGPFWDDEVTQAEREWIDNHFTSCSACREEYNQFARTLEAVSSLPRVEVAAGLGDRALSAARRAAAAPDRVEVRPGVPRWVPVAAAVVILAAVVAAPSLMGSRSGAPVARVETPVAEPRLVATINGPASAASLVPAGPSASTDSLFDHSEDVEFILDPVMLRRGRAHTGARLPDGIQGEQAVISF